MTHFCHDQYKLTYKTINGSDLRHLHYLARSQMELIIVVILTVPKLAGDLKREPWAGGEGKLNEKVTGPILTTVYVCLTGEEDI